jgi:hypothetical protein
MSEKLNKPDPALLRDWLTKAKVQYSECDECAGLHLDALKDIEGIIDSRVFLERYGLLLSSELEVRPMALMPLSADLGRINMDYPVLKIFLDVVDDATPQLVMAGILPSQAGLTLEQVANFVSMVMEATRKLAAECLQLDYLFAHGEGRPSSSKRALH